MDQFPQTPTPLSELPAPHRHFLNKKFLLTLIILAALGAAAYAGVWYYKTQSVYFDDLVVLPGRDGTEGWKTYANTQYGFEFKYPGEWYDVSESRDPVRGILAHLRSTTLPIEVGGVTPEGVEGRDYVSEGYQIFVWTQEKKMLIVDITKGIPDELISTKLDISNITAYRIDDIGGLSSGPEVYIENPKDPKNYIVINDSSFFSDRSTKGIFNQILSTFKFTDSTGGQFCGGIAAIKCPGGYSCKLDGSYPDAGGTCQQEAVTNQNTGTLTGHVTIGPNCPVEQSGRPCTPTPEANMAVRVDVLTQAGVWVTNQYLDAQGNYRFNLSPGSYTVESNGGIHQLSETKGTVTIKASQVTTLNFSIDTGIR